MDLTKEFLDKLKPLYFQSYDALKSKIIEFEEFTGVRYTIKRSVRLHESVPNREIFVYKYIQYTCNCQKCGGCQSFINICHSYGTLRIVKYWMIHSHSNEHISMVNVFNGEKAIYESPPSFIELPEGYDSDISTDQTAAFTAVVPLKSFSSFEELEKRLIQFQQTTGCLLVKRNSIRHPIGSPEHSTLVYKALTYACCHYGNGRSSSVKMQQQKTRKMNCPCIIRIGCRGKKLHIISFIMRHNHPVATELAGNYPENRRLTEDERNEINHILISSPNNTTVKEHIERKFGKTCTLNDVRQLRYRFRKQQKSCPSSDLYNQKLDFAHNSQDDVDDAYGLSLDALSDWHEHSKEQRTAQFAPYANKLEELVCATDTDTFCERIDLIKELVDLWQDGKQPVLNYNYHLKNETCDGSLRNEAIPTVATFSSSLLPCHRSGKTSYAHFNY